MADKEFPEQWLIALQFIKQFRDELWGGLVEGISFSDLVVLFVHLTQKR